MAEGERGGKEKVRRPLDDVGGAVACACGGARHRILLVVAFNLVTDI
jgi:hypothetical protein